METSSPRPVEISREDRAEAYVHARRIASTDYGAYGDNSHARHYTGRLGELAAYRWLNQRVDRVKPLFRFESSLQDADISAAGWMLEGKSWRVSAWDKYGPSLAAIQVSRIIRKANALLFVVIDDGIDPESCCIQGWVPVGDLLDICQPIWTGVARAELAVPSEAQSPPLALIRAMERRPETDAEYVQPFDTAGSCGHRTMAGICWVCAAGPSQPEIVTVTDSKTRFFHRAVYDDIREAHDRPTPIAWSTVISRVPIGEAVLDNVPCRLCFPA